MTQSGQPPGQQPQQSPPPPPPDWQSTPQQPSSPPPAQGGGMPAWTGNLTSTAPVPGPAGFYYADVPNRAIAYIIDVIILAIISFIVAAVVGGVFGGLVNTDFRSPGFGTVNTVALLAVTIVNLAISAGYFVYTWTAMRATPGMKLLGMQIGHEQDGRTITYQQGFYRWLILGIPSILATVAGYFSGTLGFLFSLVGIVWLIALLVTTAQSPTKQGLHDRYAHTVVVKAARAVG